MATQAALIRALSNKSETTKIPRHLGSKAKLPKPRKSDTLLRLVRRVKGAHMTDLQKATGWQAHSIRAGLTGLRKKGICIELNRAASGKTWYKAVEG